MPRYLLQTRTIASSGPAAAMRLAAGSFPEIAVEHCYVSHDEGCGLTTWVCRAPSETHLHRWAEASELGPVSVLRVDAHHPAEGYHNP
jgi:hypothetical protein